jgi:hypothetical protein
MEMLNFFLKRPSTPEDVLRRHLARVPPERFLPEDEQLERAAARKVFELNKKTTVPERPVLEQFKERI